VVAITVPSAALDLPVVGGRAGAPPAVRAWRASPPYRRRRALAACGLALAMVGGGLAAGRVAAMLGGAPASAPEHRPVLATYVVEPGDTVWSIARQLQPSGDISGLVRSLARANGGSELVVGQRLVLTG
jgi:hypothetical protein